MNKTNKDDSDIAFNRTGGNESSVHNADKSGEGGKGGESFNGGEPKDEAMVVEQQEGDTKGVDGDENSSSHGIFHQQNETKVGGGDDGQVRVGKESFDSAPTKNDNGKSQRRVVQRERTPAFSSTVDSDSEEERKDQDGTPIRSGSRHNTRRAQDSGWPKAGLPWKTAESSDDMSEFEDAREDESPVLDATAEAKERDKKNTVIKVPPGPIQKDTLVEEVKVGMDEKFAAMRRLTDKLLGELGSYTEALATAEQTYCKVQKEVHTEADHLSKCQNSVEQAITGMGLPGDGKPKSVGPDSRPSFPDGVRRATKKKRSVAKPKAQKHPNGVSKTLARALTKETSKKDEKSQANPSKKS
ncbi:MAG: hypothetical protein SGILL_002166 [Bacillariaceae sp.]